MVVIAGWVDALANVGTGAGTDGDTKSGTSLIASAPSGVKKDAGLRLLASTASSADGDSVTFAGTIIGEKKDLKFCIVRYMKQWMALYVELLSLVPYNLLHRLYFAVHFNYFWK